jgi:D-alanyl-D-alanine carboxypeptidase
MRLSINRTFIQILTIACMIFFAGDSFAAPSKKKTVRKDTVARNAAVVVDANTGKILYEENGEKQRYPASLTKLMTLYLTFEALEQGYLKPQQTLTVSRRAASMPKTNLNLREGDEITVHDAILALIIRSANDVAVVLAEAVSDSEEKFAKDMTLKARELGMKNTTFKNASGLPHYEQKSTAHDLARLAIAMRRDFTDYYHLFSRTKFNFGGTSYTSHNRVVNNYQYADGLKTGYINASGYNLVTSATKGDKKLVGVVLGGATAAQRDKKMVTLLEKYLHKNTKDTQKLGVIKVAKKSSNIKTIKTAFVPKPRMKP